jgi:DNA-directed RNA polymerase specialized sigma24 family protein
MPSGSVTHWLNQYMAGNAAAAQPLWERYYHRLIVMARKHLRGLPRRAADEEDVVQDGFDSFFRGAQAGRFPKLSDRDDLWQILVLITARKAIDLIHHEKRQKRGGGAVLDEGALTSADASAPHALEQVLGREPSPEFVAQMVEECGRLLHQLQNDDMRAVAILKMEGYTNEEIRQRLGCGLRTVERRLRLVRSIWESAQPS